MSALLLALLAELDEANSDTLDALRQRLAPRRHEEVPPADYLTDRLLTCSEAAEHAHVHVETIRRAVRSGTLPARRVGQSPRITAGDLDAWLGAPRRRQDSAAWSKPPSPGTRRRPLAEAVANLDAPSHKCLES